MWVNAARNAATESSATFNFRDKKNGSLGKDAKTMQCVASPIQKNRLHAATLLATSKNMSQKVQPKQCSAIAFSKVADHSVRKYIPG